MRREIVSKLEQLARKYQLTMLSEDGSETGTKVISSNLGNLYEYSEGELAVMFIPAEPRPRAWSNVKRKCLASGMIPRQIGDCEGAFSFNPSDHRQVKTALDVIRLRRKKRISPDHLRALRAGLSRTAHNPEKLSSTRPLQAPRFDDQSSDSTLGPPSGL